MNSGQDWTISDDKEAAKEVYKNEIARRDKLIMGDLLDMIGQIAAHTSIYSRTSWKQMWKSHLKASIQFGLDGCFGPNTFQKEKQDALISSITDGFENALVEGIYVPEGFIETL